MPDSSYAAKPSLSFAKLVATPSDHAWSQVYNAGNLFVCLSLTKEVPTGETLQAQGKEMFNALQSEFFSLENKNPETIKEAMQISMTKLPEEITASLVLANFKEDLLTVFIAGTGGVTMKRSDKVGKLLEKPSDTDQTITFASGYLHNGDTVVLQTGHFINGIPFETVQGALDLELPNDVVESLSPQVHEQDNGAQAAMVIRYSGPTSQQITSVAPDEEVAVPPEPLEGKDTEDEKEQEPTLATVVAEEKMDEQVAETTVVHHEEPTLADAIEKEEDIMESETVQNTHKDRFAFLQPLTTQLKKLTFHLSHRRKVFLSVAVIIFLLLGISIILTVQKENAEARKAFFAEIYPVAEQYYEEGKGLESLNKERSRESYLRADAKIKEGEAKISRGTEEYDQLEELKAKIAAALQGTPEQPTATLKEVDAPANSLLAVEKANTSGRGFGQDTAAVYMINGDVVTSFAKSNGNKKDIIENNNDWVTPKAVIPYQTNIYVLDQKNGVLKYTPSDGAFTKSSYFTGTKPNLAKANGMAIDGSIWIIDIDGRVLKYTRGQQDTFSISGLDKPLSKPTKIVTNINIENIYILDNGNSRIVQLSKEGEFQKEYPASVIGAAQDFDLDEKNNRMLIYSANKVWELPL